MKKIKHINILIISFWAFILSSCSSKIENFEKLDQYPNIFPDYIDVVIPPNIAPLNFYIKEKADDYRVEIYTDKGSKISISQTSPSIQIPENKWKKMLSENKSGILNIDVYCKNSNWIKYKTIRDSIVAEDIDNHLVYRLINPVGILWKEMGIYQRNLENFEEKAIFENKSSKHACVNCHSFSKNNPEKMSIHFRKEFGGTVIKDGDRLHKLNTKTPQTMSAFAYPAWHPNGEIIAYSVNIIRQAFRATFHKSQDVYDEASDLVLYNVKTNIVTTCPAISSKNRENLPMWSADGKYLYYISAPDKERVSASEPLNLKYDLCRIAYNVENNSWGKVDTVLTSAQTGKSITFPVTSPDGKYLVFCMTDYGYFTVYHSMSDLYVLDLQTGDYRKMEINTDRNESYHGFSSNSRWLYFSSKRIDNVYSRPFFSYIDKNGKEQKPFVMPQRDPLFYETYDKNYNRPEIVNGEVNVTAIEMRDFVRTDDKDVIFDAKVDIDALSGASWINKNKK